MKIIIPDDYQDAVRQLECFRVLQGHEVHVYHHALRTVSAQADCFRDADVLVLTRERTKITAELLALLPKLKLISQTGKIGHHIDLAACTRHGVAVAEGTGSPIAPAELAWALIMNALRRIPQAISGMRAGEWQVNLGESVAGKTIGIWGYGKIGQRIARYAKAFDAKVLVWGSETSRSKAASDGHLVASSKTAFFASADVVTLHLRLVAETEGIVTADDLSAMKPTAVFVNTARAELVERGALEAALKNGRPGFAALDVFENEPIFDRHHPLLLLPNVICTPHLGYVERNGYELYFGQAFENVIAFAQGNPQNIANPAVLATR